VVHLPPQHLRVGHTAFEGHQLSLQTRHLRKEKAEVTCGLMG
jgi:hypothetical protein